MPFYTNVITITAIVEDSEYDGCKYKLIRTHIMCPEYMFEKSDEVFNKIIGETYINFDGETYRNYEWDYVDKIAKEIKEWVDKNNYTDIPLWEAMEKHFGFVEISNSPVLEYGHIHIDMQPFIEHY
jgi:hypothetical protein